ncbi:MAG: O-antigen ligase family protein, partial [Clostridia bacterium]|nr:O-antigen ligase family protein [Clostridia bacterium]
METKETTKRRNKESRRSFFDTLSEKFFNLLRNGMFGRFFTSYDESNERYLQSIKRRKKSIGGGKIRKKISRTIEKSVMVKYVPRLVEWLLRVSTNDYGMVLLTMGIVISMSYLLNGYVLVMDIPFSMLVSGFALFLLGLPLLFSKKSIANNVYNSKLCNTLLFGFLGLDKEKMRQVSEKESVSTPSLALIFGLGLSILSYFVTPFKLLGIIGIIILSYCVLRRPEIGAVTVILILPFVSVAELQISVIYVFVCYTLKCILGKRTFKFEQFDIWVVLLLVSTLIRGAISIKLSESVMSAITTASMILFYFVVTNLIRSKEWFRRCLISLVFSGTAVAVIGILQVVIGHFSNYAVDLSKIFTSGQSAIGTFDDPNTFAHYLVAIIPFTILHFISERNGRKKMNGVLIGAVMIVALCLANSLSGIIGIVVAALLLLIIYNRNYSYLALFICIMCPLLYFTLPQNALEQLLSIKMLEGVSLNNVIAETRECFQYILEKPFGIGLGKEVFNLVFETNEGCVDNLVLQNLIEYGIIAFIVIVLFIVMLMRLTFSYCVKAKNQYRKINCCAGFCAVVGLVVSGIINYTWDDKRIFLMFWILVAFSFAYIRIERDEEEPEGLIDDYTSATLDIIIATDHYNNETQKRRYVRIPKKSKKNKKDEIDEEEIERQYEEFESSREYKIVGKNINKPIEIEDTSEVDIIKTKNKKTVTDIPNERIIIKTEENNTSIEEIAIPIEESLIIEDLKENSKENLEENLEEFENKSVNDLNENEYVENN